MKVAVRARQRQILDGVVAAVLFRDDVFDLETKERFVALNGLAVFATVVSAPTDEFTSRRVHQSAVDKRAFA